MLDIVDFSILGHKPEGYYPSSFFFALIGVILSLRWSATKRDRTYHFSGLYMLWAGVKRAVTSLVFMFIIFRMFPINSIWEMMGVGVVATLFLDQAIGLLMKRFDPIKKVLTVDDANIPKEVLPKKK